jgi:electron transfer flavoprotein alpha subunit
MSVSGAILVLAELDCGRPTRLTQELMSLGATLKSQSGGSLALACFGVQSGTVARALAVPEADRVYAVEHPALARYHSEAWVSAAAQLCRGVKPTLVLAGHTSTGADLAPRLAFRLDGAVATGCVDVTWGDGAFHYTRACYGGNVREKLSFGAQTTVATVRAGCASIVPRTARYESDIEVFSPVFEGEHARVRVVARTPDSVQGTRLEDADIIVAGGRGLNGPEGFRVLERLADALGGAVGASRVPCDLGWCPRSWQIGLTGRTVQPDLYVAVGISGAGHHMAGCGNAKTIVAVNTDPDAAIYRDARFGVVADYQEFIPALVEEVRRLKAAEAR